MSEGRGSASVRKWPLHARCEQLWKRKKDGTVCKKDVFLHLFRAENGKSAQNASFMAVDFTGKRRMALRLLRVRVKKSENRAIVFIAASVPDGAEKS